MPCGPFIGIGNRAAIMNGFGGGINGGGKNGGRASPNTGGPIRGKNHLASIERQEDTYEFGAFQLGWLHRNRSAHDQSV